MFKKTKRILVVDDEPGLTRMLKLSLEKTGNFEVCEVNVPSQALEEAIRFKPDLVLMDVMMPDVDGGSVAAQFIENTELRRIPIVFLTAIVKKSEVLAHNGSIGGFPYLAKPVDVKELNECFRKHLPG